MRKQAGDTKQNSPVQTAIYFWVSVFSALPSLFLSILPQPFLAHCGLDQALTGHAALLGHSIRPQGFSHISTSDLGFPKGVPIPQTFPYPFLANSLIVFSVSQVFTQRPG